MASGSTKAIVAALFANLGIAIAKFVGYAFTSSSSMLAEAIHSVADTTNQALLLLGSRRAAKDATPEHAFGFGRERYFWSFIVALVLFTLGGLFAIYEGWHKLGEGSHEVSNVQWAIGILVLGIFLEGYSFRTAVKESRPLKRRATTGISIAAVTGDSRWDAYGTIAIGVLLVIIATVLVFEMKSLLIGESAFAPMRKTIIEVIEGTEDVSCVLHMRTQHIGPDELLIAAKIQLRPGLDTAGVAAVINRAERRLREAISIECMIYLEPDVFDPEHPDLADA
jgi:divalent metal cation (Fe/Co/Zn/Cd) transporter